MNKPKPVTPRASRTLSATEAAQFLALISERKEAERQQAEIARTLAALNRGMATAIGILTGDPQAQINVDQRSDGTAVVSWSAPPPQGGDDAG